MDDVHYYRAHHADPAFLFTPDAEFPVCYGEKGIYHSLMTSADVPVEQRSVLSFEGGTAVNAVPGHAQAVVRAGGAPSSRRRRASRWSCSTSATPRRPWKLPACRLTSRRVPPGAQSHGHGLQRAREPAAGRRERHRDADRLLAGERPGWRRGARLLPDGGAHRGGNGTAARSILPAPTPISASSPSWRAAPPCRAAASRRPSTFAGIPPPSRATRCTRSWRRWRRRWAARARRRATTCRFCSTRKARPSRRCSPRTTRRRAEDAERAAVGGGRYAREFSLRGKLRP